MLKLSGQLMCLQLRHLNWLIHIIYIILEDVNNTGPEAHDVLVFNTKQMLEPRQCLCTFCKKGRLIFLTKDYK